MSPSLLLLALAPGAFAYEAEPADLLLQDLVPVMTGAAYETGYIPSGSPVMLNISLQTNQEAQVTMGGVAEVTWPEALSLTWTGIPGAGKLATFAELALVTSVKIDLWGYVGEWEVDRRSLEVFAETPFDPLLLPGSVPPSVSVDTTGAALEAFEVAYEPFSGLSIGLTVDLATALATTLAGIRVEHDNGSITSAEGEVVLVEPPPDGILEITSTYVGAWTSSMDLVVRPAVVVCVDIIGCYELASFDIPIDMADVSSPQTDPFEPVTTVFELPYLEPPEATWDFGEVEVGNLSNWEVVIGNQGAMDLEGTAAIVGSSYFTVSPGTVLAGDVSEDGLVVTFAPEAAGEVSATLALATNDPLWPVYEVEIRGTGVEPAETECPTTTIPAEVGCQCGTARPSGAAASLLVLSALLVRRRGSPRPGSPRRVRPRA